MTANTWPLEPGLLERFRTAGREIAWRPAPPPSRGRKAAPRPVARIAHLHDEESRVEESPTKGAFTLVADSGPVGALVLLLEMDRRGVPVSLIAREAGEVGGFPQGALEARWGGAADRRAQLPVNDLVELARYALA